uniref:2'-5'-oligoadenylate synthetase 1 domain-containing protein n=1 Tax=Chinchilla lanigera TaxID=34839 RepID=A0A8C2W5Y3_CHILA
KICKGQGSLTPSMSWSSSPCTPGSRVGRTPNSAWRGGFCTVLELVSQYRQLCVYWTVSYSAEDQAVGDFLKQQLQRPRPIILDPADPTGNLGLSARWDLLATEAAACMEARCCMGKDGTPIQPWPVRVR